MFKNVLVVTVLALFAVVGCKGDKYGDVKAVMADMIKAQEEYVAASDKVKDAKGLAAAINDFAAKMEKIKPKMKAIDEKYPDLKKQQEPPAELKESYAKMNEVTKKLMESSQKVGKFLSDPEVQKAQQKLMDVMK